MFFLLIQYQIQSFWSLKISIFFSYCTTRTQFFDSRLDSTLLSCMFFFLLSSFYSIHCAPVNSLSASLHGIVIVLSTFHTHSVRFHSSHAIQCAEHTIVEQLTEFSVDDYDRRNRTHEMSKSLSSSICSHFRFLKIVSTSIFSRFEVKCYHKKWIFCRSIPNRPFIIVVFIKHSSKCFTHVHLTNTIHT